MPLLCQQPLFHPRTEAISGSNWSQLTLKWPQFLGGRRAEKQAFVPGGLPWPRYSEKGMFIEVSVTWQLQFYFAI